MLEAQREHLAAQRETLREKLRQFEARALERNAAKLKEEMENSK